MVEITLKTDPKDPLWLIPEEKENATRNYHYRVGTRSFKWRPPTDVYETDTAIIVRVEIAGMRDCEFNISLDDRVITIQGIRPDKDERRAFHQMEIRYGEFNTTVQLNWPIDTQAVEAEYEDGILRLVLPKATTHQIKIGE